MHELPVMERILKTVLDHAGNHQVNRIVTINLRVGELTDLLDEWMQRYFDYLSKGTLAQGAVLKIERSPVVLTCRDCAELLNIEKKEWDKAICPGCGGSNLALSAGREFYIKDIEVT